MSPRSLIALPIFVFSLLLCADTRKTFLCVALTNLFGYVWIYLIWHAERNRLVWYYWSVRFATWDRATSTSSGRRRS